MKTAFKLLMLLGIIIYLGFAFTRFAEESDYATCGGVDIIIADSTHAGFITADEADRVLRNSGLYPVGKRMKNINSRQIEDALLKNPFIKEATCYKTNGRRLNIMLSQRLPLLRVMANDGKDFYIDDRGYEMEPLGYVADLIVATGKVDTAFTKRYLVDLGLFLRDNEFWNDQIEQINIDESGKADLIPRVGNQVIHLGRPDSLQKKFRNLMAFYEKVMPEVGWNKYTNIDISHTNQIIALKRDKRGKLN